MIKTDGKEIYISCGESCYCIPTEGGVRAAYFGRRIEPEDKLSELFLSSAPEFYVTDGEGNAKGDFEFVSAAAEEKRECSFPSLVGGKTVELTLVDKKLGIKAELFYTPYTRGAVARRCVVTNVGNKKISLRIPSAALRLSGEYQVEYCAKDGINYIGLNGDDAYGLLTLFGGKCDIKYACADGVTTVSATVDKTFALAAGESVETPETVLVRSEYGADGVMRAFHDILREFAVPSHFGGGRRRVVFAADKPAADGVDTAAEFGADAFVVPVSSPEKASAASEACKKRGVLFGARIDVTKRDLSDPAEVAEIYSEIHNITETLGASYIAFTVKPKYDYDGVLGLYALFKKIEKGHPEIIIEGVGDVALLRYTPIFGIEDTDTAFVKRGALCRVVPPSAIACYVTGESALKTEFDLCSLGALGYTPTADKSKGSRLAVRAQVFSYQDDSPLVLNGDFYFPKASGGDFALCVVSKDKSKAYAVYRRGGGDRFKFCGLDNHNLYHVRELDTVFSGAALSGVGVPVPSGLKSGDTMSFHLRQVADYEQ